MAGLPRRRLIGLGGAGGLLALMIARPWSWGGGAELAFDDIAGLAPFRRLAGGGSLSGGSGALLVGLDRAPVPEAERTAGDRLRPGLCATMLGGWQPGGPVPVTYFTDAFCPNCPAAERALAAASASSGVPVALSTRQLPVLGPASVWSARAVTAAGLQGQAEAMRQRLRRSAPTASPDMLTRLAASAGLEPDRFARDLLSEDTAETLAEDRALARLFGVPGTPALVIGRTLVVGTAPREALQALLEQEASEGPPACG